MYSNSGSDSSLSRSLDKSIRLIECLMKIGIIVHITETVVVSQKSNPRRRDFLIRIEIPIIIIHIISAIIKDISFIESKWQYRSRETSICSYFITVLIEDDISLRIGMSEHIENIFLIIEWPIQDSCKFTKSKSNWLHLESSFTRRTNTTINISWYYKLIPCLSQIILVIYNPISWIRYPKCLHEKYILGGDSIWEYILSIFSNSCSGTIQGVWDCLHNNIESSCECKSTSRQSPNEINLI